MSTDVKVVGSRKARKNFRDLLDRAVAGESTVIARNKKPQAVVIPFHEWEAHDTTDNAIAHEKVHSVK